VGQRAADALTLDSARSLTQPRRIAENDGQTLEIEAHLDHIPRGAGFFRHDSCLTTGERIEQARLADVGPARKNDLEPLAQNFPAMPIGQMAADCGVEIATGGNCASECRCAYVTLVEESIRPLRAKSASRTELRQLSYRSERTVRLPECQLALRLSLGSMRSADPRHGQVDLRYRKHGARTPRLGEAAGVVRRWTRDGVDDITTPGRAVRHVLAGKLLGRKQSTRARSMISPQPGCRSPRTSHPRRGTGGAMASRQSPAAGPEIRTTATPARPGRSTAQKIVATGIIVSESP